MESRLFPLIDTPDMVLYSPMARLRVTILRSGVGGDGVWSGSTDNGMPSKWVMERLRFPFNVWGMREDRVGRRLGADEEGVSVHID